MHENDHSHVRNRDDPGGNPAGGRRSDNRRASRRRWAKYPAAWEKRASDDFGGGIDEALLPAILSDDAAPQPKAGLLGRVKTAGRSFGEILVGWLRRGVRGAAGVSGTLDQAEGLEGLAGAGPGALGPVSGIGALISTLDWDSVRAEVDREVRARIVVAGAPGAGKSTLVNCLRGAPDAAEGLGAGAGVEDLGLFTLVDVAPTDGADANDDPAIWDAIQAADLVLWVLDGAAGMRAWEHEWISRVRGAGRPLLIALNKRDRVQDAAGIDRLKRTLACPVVCVAARDGLNVMEELLPRLADASPALNTALGREAPAWRPAAAQRATRRAALLSGLVGIEPLPLLDIPFQVLIALRLVLRIAAIYDEPHGDRYSRELLATMVGGVMLRYLGQQVAKLVPLFGWAVSGALAAGGAWVIGAAAERYFANGRRMPLPKLPHIKVVRE